MIRIGRRVIDPLHPDVIIDEAEMEKHRREVYEHPETHVYVGANLMLNPLQGDLLMGVGD
jgi:hypothetical protein